MILVFHQSRENPWKQATLGSLHYHHDAINDDAVKYSWNWAGSNKASEDVYSPIRGEELEDNQHDQKLIRSRETIMIVVTRFEHYNEVIMGAIASQITSLTIVNSTVYSGADQRKHESSVSLTFVWGIHQGPMNSQHKWPVTRKMFPSDDVIMKSIQTADYRF